MKLSEWIENKKNELVTIGGFKSAELKRIDNCQVSATMTSSIFSFGEAKKEIDVNTEVEDFNRSKLGMNLIDAFEVTFNVVKSRCRKPESHRTYVKVV